MSFRAGPAAAFRTDGLAVIVRVTPRAGRDALEGIGRLDNGAAFLKAAVRAAPEEGAANQALIRLLAKTLALAPSRIRLERGAASRLKTIMIEGGDLAMAERLAKTSGI